MISEDQKWMRRALRLARNGLGKTAPNPVVGAVLTKNGRLIGKGYHKNFGGPHAEVFALNEAGREAEGAVLYVTLEPCTHYGKTPPCVDRIISHGLKRVVIAAKDPNPLVDGKGIEKLRSAGIEVAVGVEGARARRLNEAFFKYIKTGLPFVTLKLAQTLDGKIAAPNGDSRWISGEASRKLVHRWRAQADAVLAGIGTVLQDDPELTVRLVRGRNPKRIVLDPDLQIPVSAKLVSDSGAENTIIFTASRNRQKIEALEKRNVKLEHCEKEPSGFFDLKKIAKRLPGLNILSVLVEGGSGVFSSFLRQGFWDRLYVFQAPLILGSGIGPFDGIKKEKLNEAFRLERVSLRRVGQDVLFKFEPLRADRTLDF